MAHTRRGSTAKAARVARMQTPASPAPYGPEPKPVTTKSDQLNKIRKDEEARLCDMCQLPRWECDELNAAQFDHIYAPMSLEQQYELTISREHFPGHDPSTCPMTPRVCNMMSGLSS